MGLVAGQIGLRLGELRLKAARIELCQELAFFDELAVLEVDADDLLRDHAADRCRVQRRDIADPGKHDWEILLFDRGGDDGNGTRGLRRDMRALREMLPAEVTRSDNRERHQSDEKRRTSPMFRDGAWRSGHFGVSSQAPALAARAANPGS